MEAQPNPTREEIVESIKPRNCMYCGSPHMQYEGSHFPRFFFSCKNCEMRMELVYNWQTRQASIG